MKVGDLVLLENRKFAAVVGKNPSCPKNSLVVVLSGDGKRYKCSPDRVLAVVGSVNVALVEENKPEPPPVRHTGITGLDGKKVGDTIKVRHPRDGIVEAEFLGINPRAHKYPVRFEYAGRTYKTSPTEVVG